MDVELYTRFRYHTTPTRRATPLFDYIFTSLGHPCKLDASCKLDDWCKLDASLPWTAREIVTRPKTGSVHLQTGSPRLQTGSSHLHSDVLMHWLADLHVKRCAVWR